MFRSRFAGLLLAAAAAVTLAGPAQAAEVDCDSVYCFTGGEFAAAEPLAGICITGLPESSAGTVKLGSRVIRPGDILTAAQLEELTFTPLRTREDQDAVLTYLPIYENRVDREAAAAISIRGKEDKAPIAEDSCLETYKNMANQGRLKATDPEGQMLTFTVTRQPKRGDVTIGDDGTFTYTPKKNKVGVDSFTYTAADPAGGVSREATVTVRILKSASSTGYTDTDAQTRFCAEWLRTNGIFAGEQIGADLCFHPEKSVTRGEFLAMVMKALDIPADEAVSATGFADDAPGWLKPYLSAALRCGLVSGYPGENGPVFRPEQPITGAEAAAILQNALKLPVSASAEEAPDTVPAWAASSVQALSEEGISLGTADTVTRAQAASALYQAAQLSSTAPGLLLVR